MKIIDLEQNTPAWLEYRRKGIGSSDAPIIMGVSPWCTPYQLYQRKMGLIPEQEENYAMMRGKVMEDEAREWINTKIKFYQFGFAYGYVYPIFEPKVIENEEFSWCFGSFDAVRIDPVGSISACEIKCPGKKDHDLALEKKIPEKYYPQLQHLMLVGGLLEILYVSYNKDNPISFWVRRDEEYIQELLKKELEFMECLNTFTPPPLTNRDKEERWDKEWIDASYRYKEIVKDILTLEEEQKFYREKLIELSNGQSCEGYGVVAKKIKRKGNIEYSKISELKGINLDIYRKPDTEYWQVGLKD